MLRSSFGRSAPRTTGCGCRLVPERPHHQSWRLVKNTSSASTDTVPDSIFDRSRMSEMRFKSRCRRRGWCGEIDLLCRQVGVGLSASCWPRIRIEFKGVRSSCDMLARNSDLYFEVSASSLPSLRGRRGLLDLLVLALHLDVALGELLRLLLELLVGLLQLALRVCNRRRAAATASAAPPFASSPRSSQDDADRRGQLLEKPICCSDKEPSEASSNTPSPGPRTGRQDDDVLGCALNRPEVSARPCRACR